MHKCYRDMPFTAACLHLFTLKRRHHHSNTHSLLKQATRIWPHSCAHMTHHNQMLTNTCRPSQT